MDTTRIKLSVFRHSHLAPADILLCLCEGQMAGATRSFYYSAIISDVECYAFVNAILTGVTLLLLLVFFC